MTKSIYKEKMRDLLENPNSDFKGDRQYALDNIYLNACFEGDVATIEKMFNYAHIQYPKNKDNFEEGLICAIDTYQTKTLNYLLNEANFPLKNVNIHEYLRLCYKNLNHAVINNRNNSNCISLLTLHIEKCLQNTYGVNNLGAASIDMKNNIINMVNVLDIEPYFQTAWIHNNLEALKFFVKHYNLTGQEPELKEFIDKQSDKTDKKQVLEAMKINLEKNTLQKEIIVENVGVIKPISQNKI